MSDSSWSYVDQNGDELDPSKLQQQAEQQMQRLEFTILAPLLQLSLHVLAHGFAQA